MAKKNSLNYINIFDVLVNMTNANIEYGYYDKVNNKRILSNMKEFDDANYLNTNCRILKAYQVWKYKIGTCWDTSMLLWFKFNKMKGLKPYVFYIEAFDKSCHTGVYVEDKNNLFYWVEYSWKCFRGIHGPYKSKEEFYKGLTHYLGYSHYYNNLKVFNSNVNFLPIYKSEDITFTKFEERCYENASIYTPQDQDKQLIKDNSIGRLDYYSIKE